MKGIEGVLSVLLSMIAVLAGPAHAGATPSAQEFARGEDPLPKLESAQAELARAAGLKLALRGTSGDARQVAREAAVRAYRVVREHYPADAPVCAEAAFRAGELLRAAEDVAGARAEFALARERGAGTPFRVRAMLELGHVERRAKNHADALAAYESVLAETDAPRRARDDASLWLGRVYMELDRSADAGRAWQRVADTGEDPLDRVRAYDYLACARVADGDLDGAAGILKSCRAALADVSAEETALGERVRSALLAMRATEELERAIAARDKQKGSVTSSGRQ
jgi:tetratricopeptide (TPR) repeat protein